MKIANGAPRAGPDEFIAMLARNGRTTVEAIHQMLSVRVRAQRILAASEALLAPFFGVKSASIAIASAIVSMALLKNSDNAASQ